MTDDEKRKLKLLFSATAAYYGHELPDEALKLYVADLSDLAFPEIQAALMELRRDPRTRRCPLPADVRQRISPPSTDENQAREAAARILTAISKYGHTNLERAKAYIGPLGWEVVRRQGGWEEICSDHFWRDTSAGVVQAQWTKLAVSLLERARSGSLDQGPSLPDRKASAQLQNLAGLLPSMPKEDK